MAINLNFNESIHDLGTTSGTIAPNVALGNVQTITLNGNLTLNEFTSPVAGQKLTLIIKTNGTNRQLNSSMLFAGSDKTLSATETTDVMSVFFDGTNYLATLMKGFAAVTIDWYNIFGNGSPSMEAVNMEIVNDNSYVMYATSTSNPIQLVKYNNIGTTQWQKTIPITASNETGLRAMVVDNAENVYVIARSSDSGGQGNSDCVLVKLDSSGNSVWQRGIGSTAFDSPFNIALDNDGNILLSSTRSGGIVTFIKYLANGTYSSQFKFTVNNAANSCLFKIDSSNNIYAAVKEFNSGGRYVIVKFDSSGTILWQKRLATSDLNNGNLSAVELDASGNFYVGINNSAGAGTIVKYNSSGVQQLQKALLLSAGFVNVRIKNLQFDNNGDFWILVSANSDNDPYVYKSDSDLTNVTLSRRISRPTGGLSASKLIVDNSNFYLSFKDGPTDLSVLFKLAKTGTKTGTYNTVYLYESATTLVRSNSGALVEETPTYSSASDNLVSYTRNFTITTTTKTSTTTSIP
jgi:hypothetical protein